VAADFTFPLNEIYVAFGDGSSNPAGTFYGLALIPESGIRDLEQKIIDVKLRHGGKPNSSVHCRELFGEHARVNTDWSHLSSDGAVSLCGAVLQATASFDPKYLAGFVPKAHYPKTFRLKGKLGSPDLVHDIDEKWLQLWAYFRVGALLDPVDLDVPEDPRVTPRPRNLPYWDMVIRRDDPGMRVSKVYLDREQTKIRWLSKSLQWISVAKALVIENKNGSSYLPIQPIATPKPPLLDIADVFTYSIGREFVEDRSIDYGHYCGQVLVDQVLNRGDEWVFGGESAD
jgi:hypothetical protein